MSETTRVILLIAPSAIVVGLIIGSLVGAPIGAL